jgi:hypothetical protein
MTNYKWDGTGSVKGFWTNWDHLKENTEMTPVPKRVFMVECIKRDSLSSRITKTFESANEAWEFYDSLLNDDTWYAKEPLTIRK